MKQEDRAKTVFTAEVFVSFENSRFEPSLKSDNSDSVLDKKKSKWKIRLQITLSYAVMSLCILPYGDKPQSNHCKLRLIWTKLIFYCETFPSQVSLKLSLPQSFAFISKMDGRPSSLFTPTSAHHTMLRWAEATQKYTPNESTDVIENR